MWFWPIFPKLPCGLFLSVFPLSRRIHCFFVFAFQKVDCVRERERGGLRSRSQFSHYIYALADFNSLECIKKTCHARSPTSASTRTRNFCDLEVLITAVLTISKCNFCDLEDICRDWCKCQVLFYSCWDVLIPFYCRKVKTT